MNATLNDTDILQEPGTLKAAVLYDDYDSRCRAKKFVDQLTTQLDDEARLSLAFWRVGVMELADFCDLTARDFAGADVLVLAMEALSCLSPPLLQWLESWAGLRANEHAALVVLVNSASPTFEGNRACAGRLYELGRLAQRHSLELFCECADQPSQESQGYIAQLRRRAQPITPMWLRCTPPFVPHPYEGWGAND